MENTKEQIARLESDLTAQAGEAVKVEFISSAMYVFGSELATLRLFAWYNTNGKFPNPKVWCGFSENRNTNYLSVEML